MLSRLKAIPWMTVGIALLAILLMLRLGFWQLSRAEQKQLRAQQLEQRAANNPLSLQDINRQPGNVADFPVQVSGHLDIGKVFLWDNRVLKGQVGYEVLVPMTTNAGDVLINFGWIKAPPLRTQLPDIDLPTALLTLQGVVVMPGDNPVSREVSESGWPRRVQQPSPEQLAKQLGRDLLPYIVQLNDSQAYGFTNNWHPLVMPAEKHLAYAVQWFGLALACFIITLIALHKQRKKHGNSRAS
ncbi:SURF1 family protein [Bowmanella denitrificans]|uniref:SURF1 family protein n=1 Tax=Bowmanella denitrificans TaxID=366582 RepID=UPI000C9AE876|nr:SURF1 family protein [Bowmanella denitrificans]